MKRAVMTVAGLVALGACSRVDDGALARLTVGRTTVDQATAALGTPARSEVLPDGSRMLTYVESHSTPKLANALPGLVYVWGGWTGTSDEAGLMFDPDGVLRFYSWSSKTGRIIKVVGNDQIQAKVSEQPAPAGDTPPPADQGGKAGSHLAD